MSEDENESDRSFALQTDTDISIDSARDIPDDALRNYYEQVADLWADAGRITYDGDALDALIVPGVAENNSRNWYRFEERRAEKAGRPWFPAHDTEDIPDEIVDWHYPVGQLTINYQSVDPEARVLWHGDWFDDRPLPDYEDIRALALFADIDFDAGAKSRPVDDATRGKIETALQFWIREYANAVGGDSDAVHVLDSVGGTYVMLQPSITIPIARWAHNDLDDDDRHRLFNEIRNRWCEYCEDVQEMIDGEIDLDCFSLDGRPNKNRLYKAPLSVHRELPGVVTPMSTDNPSYEFTRFEDVDADLAEETHEWIERFTTVDDRDIGRAAELVKTLFPDEYDDADHPAERKRAVVALEGWLDRVKEEQRQNTKDTLNADDIGLDADEISLVDDPDLPWAVIRSQDCEEVAEKLGVIDDEPSDEKTRIEVTWRRSGSGNSAFVDEDGFVDMDGMTKKGGPADLVAYKKVGGDKHEPSDWREDANHVETVITWFRENYDVPVYVPSADRDNYEKTPMWALEEVASLFDIKTDDDAFHDDEWNEVLDVLKDHDIDHGRNRSGVATVETADGEEREIPAPGKFEVNDGGYGVWDERRDDDGNTYRDWDEWTNFQIEARSYLYMPREDRFEFDLKIWPRHGRPYELTVTPDVFNEIRKFRREVCTGKTTTFDAGQSELNKIRQFVGMQDAPDRTGTQKMGVHDGELVTPSGVLGTDGWTDNPSTVFNGNDIGMERNWELNPDEHTGYDPDTVRQILELVPQMRDPERFIPVLGWYYTTPIKHLIQDWTGGFNFLFVTGETEAGKSATLETMSQLFGLKDEPMEWNITKFVMMTSFASSKNVPVWFDEYKPSEIEDWKLDTFWRTVRAATRGGNAERGNQDQSTNDYLIKAPVVVSGEARITGSAEERRAVFTTLKKRSRSDYTSTKQAFAQLTGDTYKNEDDTITDYDGYDLSEHALAYWQFAVGLDQDDLHEEWKASAEYVADLLSTHDITGLENLVEQGIQTIHLGAKLYRRFAREMGANPEDVLPMDAVDDAIMYVTTEEQGGTNRTSHVDEFFSVCARAARHDYLEEGEHYKIVHEGDADEELRIHMPSTYDKVSRYIRDHDVSADLLSSKTDYTSRMSDTIDEPDPDTYIAKVGQPTHGIGRCIGIRLRDAVEEIEDLERGAFVADADTDPDALDVTPLCDLEPGYDSVTVEVVRLESGDPAGKVPTLEGTVTDGSPYGVLDFVYWGEDPDKFDDLEEDETYLLDRVRVGHNQSGGRQIELVPKVTEVASITPGVGTLPNEETDDDQTTIENTDGDACADDDSSGETGAAADGGVELPLSRTREYFNDPDRDTVTAEDVVKDLGIDRETAEDVIDHLLLNGRIYEPADGEYRGVGE